MTTAKSVADELHNELTITTQEDKNPTLFSILNAEFNNNTLILWFHEKYENHKVDQQLENECVKLGFEQIKYIRDNVVPDDKLISLNDYCKSECRATGIHYYVEQGYKNEGDDTKKFNSLKKSIADLKIIVFKSNIDYETAHEIYDMMKQCNIIVEFKNFICDLVSQYNFIKSRFFIPNLACELRMSKFEFKIDTSLSNDEIIESINRSNLARKTDEYKQLINEFDNINIVYPKLLSKISNLFMCFEINFTIDLSSTSISNIPDFSFINSKLISIKFPKTLTSVGKYAFYGTLISKIELLNVSIKESAFKNCVNLTSLSFTNDTKDISTFIDIDRITELEVTFSKIDGAMLDEFNKLTSITFKKCKINSLQNENKTYDNIKLLTFDDCEIEELNHELFNSFNKSDLIFKNTHISTIETSSFKYMACEKIQFYNVNIDKIESCIFNESIVGMIVFENVNVNICHPEAYNNYYGNISFINYSACCNDDSVCMLGFIVFNNCSLVKYSFISNLANDVAKIRFSTNTYSKFVDNYKKNVDNTFKPTDEMKNKKFETKIEHIDINTLKPDEFKTEINENYTFEPTKENDVRVIDYEKMSVHNYDAINIGLYNGFIK